MGLAVPAALTVAIGRGAQLGVLFKGGESLERLARIDTLVLDKTGTLTEGKPEVVAVQALSGASEDEVLALAAALEQRSEHPLARAILAAAAKRSLAIPAADESGRSLEKAFRVLSPGSASQQGISLSQDWRPDPRQSLPRDQAPRHVRRSRRSSWWAY